MTWRNHCMFSQVVIDRFAMYAGRRFKVQIVGEDLFAQFSERPEGFLQLSSHIGNYEIAGYSLRSGKGIHAVVYSNEKESVMQGRSSMFSKTNVSMIALKEDMSHLFEIDSAICSGDIVSFPSDRYMAGCEVSPGAFQRSRHARGRCACGECDEVFPDRIQDIHDAAALRQKPAPEGSDFPTVQGLCGGTGANASHVSFPMVQFL